MLLVPSLCYLSLHLNGGQCDGVVASHDDGGKDAGTLLRGYRVHQGRRTLLSSPRNLGT